MAIALVAGTVSNGSGASHVSTNPATPTVGNLMVKVLTVCNGTSVGSAPTVTTPANWNASSGFGSIAGTANKQVMVLYWRYADGVNDAAPTFSMTNNSSGTSSVVSEEYSGVATVTPIDATCPFKGQSLAATSGTTTMASATTPLASDDYLLVGHAVYSAAATGTPGRTPNLSLAVTTSQAFTGKIAAANLTIQLAGLTAVTPSIAWTTNSVTNSLGMVGVLLLTAHNGTGALSVSGTGAASVAASGTGSLTLSGTAAARAATSGSGTLTLAGTAAATVAASGSASLTVVGTASATAAAAGSAALTVTGSSTATAQATGTGTLSLAGAATANVAGAGAATLTVSGAALAAAATSGTASVTVTGSALAAVSLAGAGSLTLAGAAVATVSAGGTATLTVSGQAAPTAGIGGAGHLTVAGTGAVHLSRDLTLTVTTADNPWTATTAPDRWSAATSTDRWTLTTVEA